MGVDGLLYKTTQAASLLATGLSYGPEPLRPQLSFSPSRALGDAPVDHTKPQGAFGDIVGRLDVGAGDKGEIVATIGAKAFGQSRCRASSLGSSCLLEKIISNLLQATLEGFRFELIASMDQPKQALELIE